MFDAKSAAGVLVSSVALSVFLASPQAAWADTADGSAADTGAAGSSTLTEVKAPQGAGLVAESVDGLSDGLAEGASGSVSGAAGNGAPDASGDSGKANGAQGASSGKTTNGTAASGDSSGSGNATADKTPSASAGSNAKVDAPAAAGTGSENSSKNSASTANGLTTANAKGSTTDAVKNPDAAANVSGSTASSSSVRTEANASSAKSVAPSIKNNGVYTIVSSLAGSKVLDVSGGSTADGAAVQVWGKNTTAAQRWRFVDCGNGYYEIISVKSGKALDVSNARCGNGAVVQQWARNGTKAQRWRIEASNGYVRIVSALSSSYVLDLSGANTASGTHVQLWQGNGTGAQLWRLLEQTEVVPSGFYTIKNQGSGKVLDISGGAYGDGGNLQQYNANGTLAQTFFLSYSASSGYYTIYAANSGKVLDVANGSDSNSANVWQYGSNGTAAQKWTLVKNSDGTFSFFSAVGGKALDVANGSKSSGANVQVFQGNGTAAQRWILTQVERWLPEGTYTITSALNYGNVLDVSNGGVSAGSNVQVWSGNATNAQRYYLAPVSGGYYTLQNTVSGKFVAPTKTASGANVVLSSSMYLWKPVLSTNGVVFRSKENNSIVLDVSGGSTRSGANLQAYSYNGTNAQKFVLAQTNFIVDGVYRVSLSENSKYVLDVADGSTADGAKLQIYQSNVTGAQAYRLTAFGDGTYRITNLLSGKSLTASSGDYQVTQRSSNSSNAQKWRIVCNKSGAISFVNVMNGKALDVKDNAVSNGTAVGTRQLDNGVKSQSWGLLPQSNAYYNMSISLRRMAEIQRSAYGNLSVDELMRILNPSAYSPYSFADLRVVSHATAAQLNAWIDSTSAGRNGALHGLGATFLSAAKQYGLNEVYLLAHAILESGWGTSSLAQGTTYHNEQIGSNRYTGTYYNFYGIGAYDTNANYYGGQAAAINGWNTREKAVTGAAKWIAANYVYSGNYDQQTLYAMKWDYARTNATGSRGWHQYATSTTWANSIGVLMGEFYSTYGCADGATFITPRYA